MFQCLLWLMSMMTILFFNSSSPVTLVVLIVLSSFNICVVMKLVLFTSWFSYILFLIFLGGLMVLFVYICSVASNEQISFNISPLGFLCLFLLIFLLVWLNELNTNSFFNVKSLLESMYSLFNVNLIYTSVTYLLMTLFVSVQISKMKFGPMRSKKS